MGDNGKYIDAKTLTLQIVAVEESTTIAWWRMMQENCFQIKLSL